MPKIRNIGLPPTTDANPVSNHASAATSADTHPSDHSKAGSGGGGT